MPSEQQSRRIFSRISSKTAGDEGGFGASSDLPGLHQSFVRGLLHTPIGAVPVVEARLSRQDLLGSLKFRFGIGWRKYSLDPGLYALGSPDEASPVVVSANYKASFDRLREALSGRSAWILVLDTKGVNVWCAPAKGGGGTEELVLRLQSSGLGQVVKHRRLILPQLAAPDVAAHEVRSRTGFTVSYGAVEARDLPAYLDAGMKATEAIRRKTFSLRDRIALLPMEWISSLKLLIPLCLFFLLAAGIDAESGWKTALALDSGLFMVYALLGAFFAGTTVTPALFPWLPGRTFSAKGLCPAWIIVLFLLNSRLTSPLSLPRVLESFSVLFLVPAVSSFLAMRFTGSTPITFLSGVRKEMCLALPLQIAGGLAGLALWIAAKTLRIL